MKCCGCSLSVATASSRTLPCFHAFCRPCHDKLQSSGAGGAYVSCPACLTAGTGAGGPPSTATGICRGCCRGDSPAVELVARCTTCEYPICASCERSHREMAYFSRHRVLPLTPPPLPPASGTTSSLAVGGPARASGSAGDRSGSTVSCPVHAGEHLSFYCHQCAASVCRQCCLADDPTHRRSVLNNGGSPGAAAPGINGTVQMDNLGGLSDPLAGGGGLSYLEKIAETKAAQLKVCHDGRNFLSIRKI